MTPDELFGARYALGTAWGLGRALTLAEFGRILDLAGKDPGESMRDLERGKTRISGPLALAVDLMIAGAQPANWRDCITERTPR